MIVPLREQRCKPASSDVNRDTLLTHSCLSETTSVVLAYAASPYLAVPCLILRTRIFPPLLTSVLTIFTRKLGPRGFSMHLLTHTNSNAHKRSRLSYQYLYPAIKDASVAVAGCELGPAILGSGLDNSIPQLHSLTDSVCLLEPSSYTYSLYWN